jgi:hypothetical protein
MNKMFPVRIESAMIVFLVLLTGVFTGCKNAETTGFNIILADTGAVVLSTQHIKSYDPTTYTLELNEKGIKQWNSYLTYTSIPKLADSLNGKDFSVQVNGKEMYRGEFLSNVVSSTRDGIVILDALMKLDDTNNTIRIGFGYPGDSYGKGEDPRNNPEIIKLFKEQGLLKESQGTTPSCCES